MCYPSTPSTLATTVALVANFTLQPLWRCPLRLAKKIHKDLPQTPRKTGKPKITVRVAPIEGYNKTCPREIFKALSEKLCDFYFHCCFDNIWYFNVFRCWQYFTFRFYIVWCILFWELGVGQLSYFFTAWTHMCTYPSVVCFTIPLADPSTVWNIYLILLIVCVCVWGTVCSFSSEVSCSNSNFRSHFKARYFVLIWRLLRCIVLHTQLLTWREVCFYGQSEGSSVLCTVQCTVQGGGVPDTVQKNGLNSTEACHSARFSHMCWA